MEFKYTETMSESAPLPPDHQACLAEEIGIHKEPRNVLLRLAPLQQLFREHLLASAAVMRGLWRTATLVSVAPAANTRVQRHSDLYASFLKPPVAGQVPFVHVTLDAFVDALGQAGGHVQAALFNGRYLDWSHVDALVADALDKRVAKWPRLATGKPPALLPGAWG